MSSATKKIAEKVRKINLWQYMLRSTSEDAEKVEHETNFNFRVPSHIHQFSIA